MSDDASEESTPKRPKKLVVEPEEAIEESAGLVAADGLAGGDEAKSKDQTGETSVPWKENKRRRSKLDFELSIANRRFFILIAFIVIIVSLFFVKSHIAPRVFLGDSTKPDPQALQAQVSRLHSADENLFPLKQGNKWTYDYAELLDGVQSTIARTMVVQVVDTTETVQGTKGVLSFTLDGIPESRETWLVSGQGLYELTDGLKDTKFTPMEPVILFPVVPAASYKWKGTGIEPDGSLGLMEVNNNVGEPVMADTSMGSLPAIQVESLTNFKLDGKPAKAKATSYFQRGVGLVRYKMTILVGGHYHSILIKLRSHTLNS